MEQRGDTVRSVVHKPLLKGGHTVAQIIGIPGLLQGKLRKMPYPVRYKLPALGCIQITLRVKEHIHVHAP